MMHDGCRTFVEMQDPYAYAYGSGKCRLLSLEQVPWIPEHQGVMLLLLLLLLVLLLLLLLAAVEVEVVVVVVAVATPAPTNYACQTRVLEARVCKVKKWILRQLRKCSKKTE